MKFVVAFSMLLLLIGCDDSSSSSGSFDCDQCKSWQVCKPENNRCELGVDKCSSDLDCSARTDGQVVCGGVDLHSCTCPDGNHFEDGACGANSKEVNCITPETVPTNGEAIVVPVMITWDGAKWTEVLTCNWRCQAGFTKDGESCKSGYTDPCETNPCIDSNKTVCSDIDTDGVAECSCDAGYEDQDGRCVQEVVDLCKDVVCGDNSGCNGETGVCDCDDGFVKDGEDCVASDLCKDVTCGANSSCNGETGVCECDSLHHSDGENCVSDTKMISCNNTAPAYATAEIIDVAVTWSDGVWSDPAECSWSCSTTYHLEEGACLSDTNMVPCVDVTPLNGTSISENVAITWSGSAWPAAANCNWNCNNNYHTEDSLTCIANSKTVNCSDVAPENGTSVIDTVAVTWSDGSWSSAASCSWSCDKGFHKEGDLCEADPTVFAGDLVVTEVMANPAAVTDSLGEWIEIYNNRSDSIDITNLVIKRGTSEYSLSSGDTTINAKSYFVIAKSSSAGITYNAISDKISLTNSESTISLELDGVILDTLTYPAASAGKSWQRDESKQWCEGRWIITGTTDTGTPGTAENCNIVDPCLGVVCSTSAHCENGSCVCDDGYHNDGDGCVSDTQFAMCNNVTPENATTQIQTVKIIWSNGSWSEPADCNWSCKSSYHQEGDICMSNTDMVSCVDVAPTHATSTVIDVSIVWSNDSWSTPANCNWSCDSGYLLQDGSCVVVPDVRSGDLIFTEVMANPDAVSDTAGEWIEIYNTTAKAIDISSLKIKRSTNDYTIQSGDTTIAANSYLVIARSSGAMITYDAISNISLTNIQTTLSLEMDGVALDQITYPVAKPGISWQRDETDQWCESTWTISESGDMGTPGSAKSCAIVDPCSGVTCGSNEHCDAGSCICDAGYHMDGGSCIDDSKMVFCTDVAPTNGTSSFIRVEVVWTGSGWTTPSVCDWSCDSGYLQSGNSCILDQTECTGFSIDTFTVDGNNNLASSSGDDDFVIEFFASTPSGSYDLASSNNNNYKTCEQCALIRNGETDKIYFQESGSLFITDGDAQIGKSTGSIATVKLIEVTIDKDNNYLSTPVTDGECFEIETAAWDTMPECQSDEDCTDSSKPVCDTVNGGVCVAESTCIASSNSTTPDPLLVDGSVNSGTLCEKTVEVNGDFYYFTLEAGASLIISVTEGDSFSFDVLNDALDTYLGELNSATSYTYTNSGTTAVNYYFQVSDYYDAGLPGDYAFTATVSGGSGCTENAQRCHNNNVETCTGGSWGVTDNCDSGETCNSTTFTCDSASTTCIGISIDGALLAESGNENRYNGSISTGGTIQLGFYGTTPAATYDLGSVGVNDNYKTCSQCVRVTEDGKEYFQESGTMTVTESNGYDSGESAGTLVSVKLVEVTIDSSTFISTPVTEGSCLELETGSWNTIPGAITCADLNCTQYANAHCDDSSGEAGCYCDTGYILNDAGDGCELDPDQSTCIGLSIGAITASEQYGNLYQGSDGDYDLSIIFYGEVSDTTYDLGSAGVNDNYETCEQCLKIENSSKSKTYFQESGSMVITETNGYKSGEIAASIVSVKLVEVTIDGIVSTPVTNGECLEIETATWNTMPTSCSGDDECNSGYHCNTDTGLCEADAATCEDLNCTQYANAHCDESGDAPSCVCDDGYVVNNAGDGCELPSLQKNWTVMVYLDADNNLEGPGIEDFNEMEKGLYDSIQAGNSDLMDNLNLIVLIDRTSGESYSATESGGSDWTDARIYSVQPDSNMTYFNSTRLDDGGSESGHMNPIGEINMGDPDTLEWFVNYAKTNFPADNYGLVFWNHGGGARSNEGTDAPIVKAVCWDDDNGSDPLYMNELQTALATQFSSGDKLDLIGFDACLMATIEVAYEFKDLARYMVGSMNSEQGDGWDYEYIFGNIRGSRDESTLGADVLAKLVVEAYEQFIDNYGYGSGETQSATDLSLMGTLKAAVDQFAADLHSENKKTSIESIRNSGVHYDEGYNAEYPYWDLYDFANGIASSTTFTSTLRASANSVIDALGNTIIKTYGEAGNGQSRYSNDDSSAKRGLTIFFSRSSSDYSGYGGQNDWYTAGYGSSAGDGYLDFANTTSDSLVNTWKELMDAWY